MLFKQLACDMQSFNCNYKRAILKMPESVDRSAAWFCNSIEVPTSFRW